MEYTDFQSALVKAEKAVENYPRAHDRRSPIHLSALRFKALCRRGSCKPIPHQYGLDRERNSLLDGRDACENNGYSCEYLGGNSLSNARSPQTETTTSATADI